MTARRAEVGLVGFLLVLLTGCAWLGVTQPETFNQRVLYAYASLEAVVDAADAALDSGLISGTEALAVVEVAERVDSLLSVAISLSARDGAGAESRLALAIRILSEIERYLGSLK